MSESKRFQLLGTTDLMVAATGSFDPNWRYSQPTLPLVDTGITDQEKIAAGQAVEVLQYWVEKEIDSKLHGTARVNGKYAGSPPAPPANAVGNYLVSRYTPWVCDDKLPYPKPVERYIYYGSQSQTKWPAYVPTPEILGSRARVLSAGWHARLPRRPDLEQALTPAERRVVRRAPPVFEYWLNSVVTDFCNQKAVPPENNPTPPLNQPTDRISKYMMYQMGPIQNQIFDPEQDATDAEDHEVLRYFTRES